LHIAAILIDHNKSYDTNIHTDLTQDSNWQCTFLMDNKKDRLILRVFLCVWPIQLNG